MVTAKGSLAWTGEKVQVAVSQLNPMALSWGLAYPPSAR